MGLVTTDEPGQFGDGTVAVVEAFQRTRGLAITGQADPTTWARLIEAGWHLGSRLLFQTTPMLRGDDVAELQVRLAQLGFNPGRIDGIFGKILDQTLRDFQQNVGLVPDGTLTRQTLNEVLRLSGSASARQLVNDARDRAGFDEIGSGPVLVWGDGELAHELARGLPEILDGRHLVKGSSEETARFANTLGAACVLSTESVNELEGLRLHYWMSYRSHSRRGEQLSNDLVAALRQELPLLHVESSGMALPILRETKMTTLHLQHGDLTGSSASDVARVISAVLGQVFHR